MLRRTILPILLFLTLAMPLGLQAQLSSKATFFGGFTYHALNLTPQGSNSPLRYFYYGLSAGMDYVLFHSNDVISLGINPNAHFSFQYDASSGFSMLGSAPVFLLARVGANATPFNEQRVGIGAGIGLNPNYLSQRSYVQDLTGTVYQLRINQPFVTPSAVAELSLNTRGMNYILRFHWSLYKPSHEIRVGIDRYPFAFGTGGLGILYNF